MGKEESRQGKRSPNLRPAIPFETHAVPPDTESPPRCLNPSGLPEFQATKTTVTGGVETQSDRERGGASLTSSAFPTAIGLWTGQV